MSDVCLILEGTYPYVSGGVSTWVDQLITSMPEIKFSILYISPFPNPNRQLKYELPANVTEIQDIFLHDYQINQRQSPAKQRKEGLRAIAELHWDYIQGKKISLEKVLPYFQNPELRLTSYDIFQSEEAWDFLMEFYHQYAEDVSFSDFFWTWRSINLPLYQTLQTRMPKAKLYHTISTGYAGLAAAVAKLSQDTSMLLTEHGIYTHERFLEISQASWIYSENHDRFRIQKELPFFKKWWLNFFDFLGKTTYGYADKTITLYEGNKSKEIIAGADSNKIVIIPNGIHPEPFEKIRQQRAKERSFQVGFVGRVVSIKDVLTFIHAARMALTQLPQCEFFILGPMDEEPEYARECLELVKTLELNNKIHFPGKVRLSDYYAKLDLVALTSLSEAQPYVILEANASGIPVVASDVGACREMLEGGTPADRALGASGLLTQVSNPEDTAQAIVRLLKDPDLWQRCAQAGIQRTKLYYDQKNLISKYLNLYEQHMK